MNEKGGAWDNKTHAARTGYAFNVGLAKFILNSLAPKSVLEVGSGRGALAHYINTRIWKNPGVKCQESVICVEPYDIKGMYDPVLGPELYVLDILKHSLPKDVDVEYDLVMCIEVAEHIERKQHTKLFDFLVGHTSRLILFSGGHPGQPGLGHIACREEEDWRSEFTNRGMQFLSSTTEHAREACDKQNKNHAKNIQVFLKP